MKHKISGYKLQRNASARKALLRALVISRQRPGRPRGMQEFAAAQVGKEGVSLVRGKSKTTTVR